MQEDILESQRIKPITTPRELMMRYIRYLPWLAISVAVMLMLAYVKLRYSTYIYNVSGKLMVTNPLPYSNSSEKFDDIFMMQRGDRINDEIEIIKSRSLASRVVRALGVQLMIYNKGKIRSTAIHPHDVPFTFDIQQITDSTVGFTVLVTFLNDNEFTLNTKPEKHVYNEVIQMPGATFRILPNGRGRSGFASNIFVISWQPIDRMAAGFAGTLNVVRVNDYSNVLNLSYQTENIQLGKDIVNQYMTEYQQASLEDKKLIAGKALAFIDDQLVSVQKDLGGAEQNLQNKKEVNKIFVPDAQSELLFNQLGESDKQMVQLGIKLKAAELLQDYLSDQDHRYNIISSMQTVDEPALMQQVTEFNRLQLERETALKNNGPNNPRILGMEAALEKLRVDMIETIKNYRKTNAMALQEISRRNKEADQLISSIPSKEKQMREVTRQQMILQELYSYLLQKKLETSIASASTISNIKVIEPALSSGVPVSPSKRMLYLVAILLGVTIPAGVVFLREYLNDKVKSRYDVEQMTDAPILGEIGHAEESNTLVVKSNSRKFLAEQFRIVRSNLQYILPKIEKPVFLITSTFSGEGKSFISTNLGSAIALGGKRTVILEFDIRKPKILKGLGLHERKGITNYIVGNINLQDVIHPVPEVENLYVIPCGPVPPNPAEMLLNEKVNQLFKELRTMFDAIIIDTAPVGLVSDAFTLGHQADATVYIIRHDYTLKKQLQLIDNIYEYKKLPNLSIIINDIQARGSGYGGYYGYGGYGYGYGGYGYGYGVRNNGHGDYFDHSPGKKKSWFRKLTGSK